MAVDPVQLATLTVAVTKIAEGAASEIGKDLWTKVKSVFGWTQEPAPEALPATTASALVKNPELVSQLAVLIKDIAPSTTYAQYFFHAERIGVGVNHGTVDVKF